ncbi:uncharacterized protein N7477_004992 [Penicillium maclennaniae]|uniref:uncharacterized protein n=1 Tax=Penicillium maclennaniae TaxID=1343394 RepID=UPI00254050B0|nr:uncharacterized protein N7477_004992 [Penicillium maclennaniae]KAJ5675058.1 hypothetical protein N7477_004992 [Penicillium maclennaniae]
MKELYVLSGASSSMSVILGIKNAVSYVSEAFGTNQDPDEEAVYSILLSNVLGSRFEMTEYLKDLACAIDLAREVVEATSEEDQQVLADRRHNLSTLLGDRYGRFDSVTDLEEAISLEESVIPAFNHDQAKLLRENATDLTRAIGMARDVLNRTSTQSEEERAIYYFHMAHRLSGRYKFSGSIDDLQDAIEMMEKARQAIVADDLYLLDITIDLSNLLRRRYLHLGLSNDLVIEVTPPNGYKTTDIQESIHFAEKALSYALETQLEALGSLLSVERSIAIIKEGLDSIAIDQNTTANLQYALSQRFLQRYQQLGSLVDLQESIYVMQECKEDTPANQPGQTACLYSLGIRQGCLFDRSNDVSDLDEAIDLTSEAPALIPDHDMTRANALQGLGTLYESHFKATDSQRNLQRAVEVSLEALQEVPEDYSERHSFLSNLGDLLCLYPATGGSDDQKFIPSISKDKVARLACSDGCRATSHWVHIQGPMFHLAPFVLGSPGKLTQSSHYLRLKERFFT